MVIKYRKQTYKWHIGAKCMLKKTTLISEDSNLAHTLRAETLLKAYPDQAKAKAKIFFDFCLSFFDLFRLFFDRFRFRFLFRLVWVGPKVTLAEIALCTINSLEDRQDLVKVSSSEEPYSAHTAKQSLRIKWNPSQWRIQDFQEGAPTPKGENCMKMEKFCRQASLESPS